MFESSVGWLALYALCAIPFTSLTSCDQTKIKENVVVNNFNHTDERHFIPKREECEIVRGYFLNGKTSPESYSHWHVRLNRHDTIYWNGVPVDGYTLSSYLLKLSRMNASSEFISVEIEPGASCAAVGNLRRAVVASGLCSLGRCTENVWDIQSPVVS